jgi:hypothetical protein
MALFICKLGKCRQQRHSGDIRRRLVALVLIIACSIVAPAYADPLPAGNYDGGNGSMATPYLISNLSELHRLTVTVEDWTKFFELSANIDAADTST